MPQPTPLPDEGPVHLRPPKPRGWPVMSMVWANVLFAHWPVSPEAMRQVLPAPLLPDIFDGQAWIGLVPFTMPSVRPLGIPVPPAHAFHECNVRTYVTVDGEPGIYFFSLDAASRLAVAGARLSVGLPYFHAQITMTPAGNDGFDYRVRRNADVTSHVIWRCGEPLPIREPDSLDWFLTERYCLYAVHHHGLGGARPGPLRRLRIRHHRWPLRQAWVDHVDDRLIPAVGLDVSGPPVHVLASDGVAVKAWLPGRV